MHLSFEKGLICENTSSFSQYPWKNQNRLSFKGIFEKTMLWNTEKVCKELFRRLYSFKLLLMTLTVNIMQLMKILSVILLEITPEANSQIFLVSSGPLQNSVKHIRQLYVNIVNGFQLLTIFAKSSILKCWMSSEYASVLFSGTTPEESFWRTE